MYAVFLNYRNLFRLFFHLPIGFLRFLLSYLSLYILVFKFEKVWSVYNFLHSLHFHFINKLYVCGLLTECFWRKVYYYKFITLTFFENNLFTYVMDLYCFLGDGAWLTLHDKSEFVSSSGSSSSICLLLIDILKSVNDVCLLSVIFMLHFGLSLVLSFCVA